MATRFSISITRPTGTGGHDPVSGQWLPGSVVEVWSGRADVIDDRLTLQQYADGDTAYADADVLIFLRESVFHTIHERDSVRWTVAGEERYGVVLGSIEVASALIVEMISKEAAALPSGLHISSQPIASAAVGDAYIYTITTADADGPVTLAALSKPDWILFTDHEDGTATLEGTPDQSDVGDVPITIQASDGVGLTAQAFVLTVQGGAPIYVAQVIPPLVVDEAMALGWNSAGLANNQTWGWVDGVWQGVGLGGSWDDLTGKPSTFPPSAHPTDWGEVQNAPAQATRWPAWGEVTDKPASFGAFLLNGSDAYYDAGKVAIGHDAPTADLHIRGGVNDTTLLLDSSSSGYSGKFGMGSGNVYMRAVGDQMEFAASSQVRFKETLSHVDNGDVVVQFELGTKQFAFGIDYHENTMDIAGGVAIGENAAGNETAPVNGLLVEGDIVAGLFNDVDVAQLKADFDAYTPPTPDVAWGDLTGTPFEINVQAQVGQTDPLLVLADSVGTPVFSVDTEGNAFTGKSLGVGTSAPASVIGDGFDRSDDALSMGDTPQGYEWIDGSDVPTTWGIESGQARQMSAGNNRVVSYVETGLSDATVGVTSAVGGGLVFRYIDYRNYWFIFRDGTRWLLRSYVDYAIVRTEVIQSDGAADGDVIHVDLDGDTIKCYVNGVLKTTVVDDTHQYATKHGLSGGYNALSYRWEDFFVTKTDALHVRNLSIFGSDTEGPTMHIPRSREGAGFILGRMAIGRPDAYYDFDVQGDIHASGDFYRAGVNLDDIYVDARVSAKNFVPTFGTLTQITKSNLYDDQINTGVFNTAPGVLAYDSFERADSATDLGTTEVGGLAWSVEDLTTWGISGGQAYKVSGGNNAPCAIIDPGVEDVTVQTTIAVGDVGGGLMFRYQDETNHFRVYNNSTTNYIVLKRVANAITVIATINTAPAPGDVLKVRIKGDDFGVYINGVLEHSFTDTDLAGSTGVGISGQWNNSIHRFEDFMVSRTDVLEVGSSTRPSTVRVNDLVEITEDGDVELLDSSIGVIQKSPNGTRYRITVADDGSRVAMAL